MCWSLFSVSDHDRLSQMWKLLASSRAMIPWHSSSADITAIYAKGKTITNRLEKCSIDHDTWLTGQKLLYSRAISGATRELFSKTNMLGGNDVIKRSGSQVPSFLLQMQMTSFVILHPPAACTQDSMNSLTPWYGGKHSHPRRRMWIPLFEAIITKKSVIFPNFCSNYSLLCMIT